MFGSLAVAALCSACGAPSLIRLPAGPGNPATDLVDVEMQALHACRSVSSLTAEIAVSGSVAGRRVRGRLVAGFDTTSARLEAAAPFGAPVFIFVARNSDATLLLPRDARVLEHAKPADALAAIAGIALGPSELFQTVIGCNMPEHLGSPAAIGDAWRTAAGDGGARVYFHREGAGAPWRLVTVLFTGEGLQWSWRVDYPEFQNDLPRAVRLISADKKRFDLQLAFSQVETNLPLSADAFRVVIPAAYERITIDDLRRAGPLGSDGE